MDPWPWVSAVSVPSRRLLALQSLLGQLDPVSQRTLHAILAFLQRLAIAAPAGAGTSHSRAVSVRVLSSLFSPLLLRPRAGEMGRLAEDVARADQVVELLVEECGTLFGDHKHQSAASQRAVNAGDRALQESNSSRLDNNTGAKPTDAKSPPARAMRTLSLTGKENAGMPDMHASMIEGKTGGFVPVSQGAEADNGEVDSMGVNDVDGGVADCVGRLFSGDDWLCAEADRVAGTGLEVLYMTPINKLSLNELQAEKTAIKRRLRSFDNVVANNSGRKATKEDKRHLRPLYLRLAHVKRHIHMQETRRGGRY